MSINIKQIHVLHFHIKRLARFLIYHKQGGLFNVYFLICYSDKECQMGTDINVAGLWFVHRQYFVSACLVLTILVMSTPTIVLPQERMAISTDQKLQKESLHDLTTVVETTSSDTQGLHNSSLSVQESRFFWGPDGKPFYPP
jgi:hypothetical protein